MCQCKNCGEKKWSQRRKNVNKALCLTIINLGLWGVVIDATANWHREKFDLNFTNPKIAAVYATHSLSESSKTGSPETENTVLGDGIVVPQTQTLGSSASTHTSPVRASGVIEAKIRAAFPEDPDTAVAVAKCESQLDPTRVGDTHMTYPSVGLFQINQTWHKYDTETLKNADENIRIAKEIKGRWGNWNAWSCYKFDFYKKYLASN